LSAKKTNAVDHLARLRAVERYCELLELAQGKEQETGNDANRQVTWEELTEMYEPRRERAHAEEDAGPVMPAWLSHLPASEFKQNQTWRSGTRSQASASVVESV
jgi:hypothetical protein